MNTLRQKSLLICSVLFLLATVSGVILKWPEIEPHVTRLLDDSNSVQPQGIKLDSGVDPFEREPKLPSLVKELHPVYDIHAELFPEQSKIKGKLRVEFDNPHTSLLLFYLYDYPCCPMKITSVQGEGKSVTYQRRNRHMEMANPFTGKRVAVEIQFETSVPRQGTRFGVEEEIWTLTNWYPQIGALNGQGSWYLPPDPQGFGDPFVYQYADYEVTFVSPRTFQWVTSWGRGENVSSAGTKQTLHYKGKRLLNFSLVGSPRFHIETFHVGDLTVDAAVVDSSHMQTVQEIGKSALHLFQTLYGELPYPRIGIAVTGYNTTYAMEYANLAVLSRRMFQSDLIHHWLTHELAHLWWYNSIATLEAEHGWLDEGLVELAVYDYLKTRFGKDKGNKLMAEYQAEEKKLAQAYPKGYLGKRLKDFQSENEFDHTWYSKGAMLYWKLRNQIGDDAFFQFLKHVQRTYHGIIIGPEHLDQALRVSLNGKASYFVPNLRRTNAAGLKPAHVEYHAQLVLNGVPYYPPRPALIRDKTVYLPLRDVEGRLGHQVDWNFRTDMIRVKAGNKTYSMQERSSVVISGVERYRMDHPLLEINNHTMVPLSFYEKVMGYHVEFDRAQRIVSIRVPKSGE